MVIPSKKGNTSAFILEINSIVDQNGISYFDAVLEYCQRKQIPVENIATLVRQLPKLKGKIRQEAEKLNMIKVSKKV